MYWLVLIFKYLHILSYLVFIILISGDIFTAILQKSKFKIVTQASQNVQFRSSQNPSSKRLQNLLISYMRACVNHNKYAKHNRYIRKRHFNLFYLFRMQNKIVYNFIQISYYSKSLKLVIRFSQYFYLFLHFSYID